MKKGLPHLRKTVSSQDICN